MKRIFRGAEYDIVIKNPAGVQKGVCSITVDGKPIAGQLVAAADGHHLVEVVLG